MNSAGAAVGMDIWTEVVKHPVSSAVLGAWEALAKNPLEANPFLSPAYLGLLAQHMAHDADWRLALVWSDAGRTALIGLAPVMSTRGGSALKRHSAPHRHRMLPLGHPLLSDKHGLARMALSAFLETMGNQIALDLTAITRAGPTAQLLKSLCQELGWVHDTMKDAPTTHGLHLLNAPQDTHEAHIKLTTSVDDIRDGMEHLLALAGTAKSRIADDDAATFTFLRAMTREMARREGVVLAQIDTQTTRAVALALRHGTQSWIVRMDGPGASDP